MVHRRAPRPARRGGEDAGEARADRLGERDVRHQAVAEEGVGPVAGAVEELVGHHDVGRACTRSSSSRPPRPRSDALDAERLEAVDVGAEVELASAAGGGRGRGAAGRPPSGRRARRGRRRPKARPTASSIRRSSSTCSPSIAYRPLPPITPIRTSLIRTSSSLVCELRMPARVASRRLSTRLARRSRPAQLGAGARRLAPPRRAPWRAPAAAAPSTSGAASPRQAATKASSSRRSGSAFSTGRSARHDLRRRRPPSLQPVALDLLRLVVERVVAAAAGRRAACAPARRRPARRSGWRRSPRRARCRALAMSILRRQHGDAGGPHLGDRAGVERVQDLQVVDHQVEHHVDVEAARREDRQPLDLDEARRRSRRASSACTAGL